MLATWVMPEAAPGAVAALVSGVRPGPMGLIDVDIFSSLLICAAAERGGHFFHPGRLRALVALLLLLIFVGTAGTAIRLTFFITALRMIGIRLGAFAGAPDLGLVAVVFQTADEIGDAAAEAAGEVDVGSADGDAHLAVLFDHADFDVLAVAGEADGELADGFA